jgi:deferrochelatase/peroxidase EfeB
LALSPDGPSERIPKDAAFAFKAQDPHGLRCPFSAHIRVTNPRDQDLDPIETDGVPRLIRRGMPYGPEMSSEQVDDDGVDRGIIGIFICSNIRRQFYTLTRWISETSFSPVFDGQRHGQDPLFGNRHFPAASSPSASNSFVMASPSGLRTISPLQEFVHTKGTAFFLLPSLSALQKLVE